MRNRFLNGIFVHDNFFVCFVFFYYFWFIWTVVWIKINQISSISKIKCCISTSIFLNQRYFQMLIWRLCIFLSVLQLTFTFKLIFRRLTDRVEQYERIQCAHKRQTRNFSANRVPATCITIANSFNKWVSHTFIYKRFCPVGINIQHTVCNYISALYW